MTKQNSAKREKSKSAPGRSSGTKGNGAGLPSMLPAKTHKLEIVICLLRRPEGASIEELAAATGWQPHSVRALISRALKKKQVLTITTVGTGLSRVYRVAG